MHEFMEALQGFSSMEKEKCMCSWRRYEASAPRKKNNACVHGGVMRLQLHEKREMHVFMEALRGFSSMKNERCMCSWRHYVASAP